MRRLRRCPICLTERPTRAFVLIDDGVMQHRNRRRRCPTCGAERWARLFLIVPRRPPLDRPPLDAA